MRNVYVIADNIYSPLGETTAANLAGLKLNHSGIQQHTRSLFSETPFYSSLFNDEIFKTSGKDNTRFEQMLIASISEALMHAQIDTKNKRTLLIISSTKGNISLLENEQKPSKDELSLSGSANKVARHFNFSSTPIVISNACISGVMAMLTGFRLIRSGQFDHVVVSGADAISKFILSGFQSFQAISNERCKPFDKNRTGINLGEAAATVVLSAKMKSPDDIRIEGGAISNDANHISGPSRTGQELCNAIEKTLRLARTNADEIDLVSAHGTATLYNDEMEAKAIHLAGLASKRVNSLKGFYGHTLGAAGILESVISMHSMKENIIYPTMGFENSGVSVPLELSNQITSQTVNKVLKTASGFGGCNAAMLFSKQ